MVGNETFTKLKFIDQLQLMFDILIHCTICTSQVYKELWIILHGKISEENNNLKI